jgi:hypothetical protein
MVDSIKPTYRPLTTTQHQRRDAASEVESHNDDKEALPVFRGRDRRRGGDRRNREGEIRKEIFEMRNSDGRRKSDRSHPSIETKA